MLYHFLHMLIHWFLYKLSCTRNSTKVFCTFSSKNYLSRSSSSVISSILLVELENSFLKINNISVLGNACVIELTLEFCIERIFVLTRETKRIQVLWQVLSFSSYYQENLQTGTNKIVTSFWTWLWFVH